MPDRYIVECPNCGFRGGENTDFDMTLSDECFCPECDYSFELVIETDDDEDDED